MNMFDANEKLKKYNSAEEIIDDYYGVRLEYYEKRKAYMVNALKRELLVLSNRARYITELLDDTIDLRRKTNKMLTALLKERNYDVYVAGKGETGEANGVSSGDTDDENGYKYLLKLPMDSVSEENVTKLRNEKAKKEEELGNLGSKSLEQLWQNDLAELEVEYTKFVERTALGAATPAPTALKPTKTPKAKK
jgi:DNA topoisomerase-2